MSTFDVPRQNQIPQKKTFPRKIKDIWLKYGEKVILLLGIILIALVSFEAGFLKGQKNQKEPVEIKQAVCPPSLGETNTPNSRDEEKNANNQNSGAALPNKQNETQNQPNTDNQKCAFVASKNSDKYHLPTCPSAQKIKPENKICFSSAEEAQARGYQGAKCCIK
jgi:hypothetical protein